MTGRRPDAIDRLVGLRIRERRKTLHHSQGFFGNAIGLSRAEVGKIERGTNRVSASHLYQISQCLRVDLYYFFASVRNALTGPGFQEEARDWLPRTTAPEFIEHIAAILREVPDEAHIALLEQIKELAHKTSARPGDTD